MYFFSSRIRYSESDCDGRLTMAALLNYFQDCSTFQSEDLGLGLTYMREARLVWVLSSWQIVVERYPRMGEQVQIGTLPYEFKRFLGCRNFLMQTAEGECLAKANSLWSLLDVDTGKPTLPTEAIYKGFAVEERLDMDYAPRRIAVPADGVMQEPIVVRKHHLDTNHHVNNGQFVDMTMHYLPEDFRIHQLRAEYKKQAFLEDVLRPCVAWEEKRCVVSLLDETDRPYVIVEFT